MAFVAVGGASGAIAIGGAAASLIGGIFGGVKAKKQARAAAAEKNKLSLQLNSLENSRQAIINPWASSKDLSGIITDTSGMLSNPYANIGVATQAAEIQAEEADISLANTLDTLRATGSGAGGATALAQAALQSKKGIAASIEQQESANEKLKADGESSLQQSKMAEQQRIQGAQLGEGQRMQATDAQGQQFVFGQTENREMQQLNRVQSKIDNAGAQETQANQNASAAWSSALSSVGSIAGAAAGSIGGGGGSGITPQGAFQQPAQLPANIGYKFGE